MALVAGISVVMPNSLSALDHWSVNAFIGLDEDTAVGSGMIGCSSAVFLCSALAKPNQSDEVSPFEEHQEQVYWLVEIIVHVASTIERARIPVTRNKPVRHGVLQEKKTRPCLVWALSEFNRPDIDRSDDRLSMGLYLWKPCCSCFSLQGQSFIVLLEKIVIYTHRRFHFGTSYDFQVDGRYHCSKDRWRLVAVVAIVSTDTIGSCHGQLFLLLLLSELHSR